MTLQETAATIVLVVPQTHGTHCHPNSCKLHILYEFSFFGCRTWCHSLVIQEVWEGDTCRLVPIDYNRSWPLTSIDDKILTKRRPIKGIQVLTLHDHS